ncbi:MAG: hypothetical protein IJJ76_09915 [Ruminococcus sp.]|uniref:hypothetical protein n=1 Tax=Ruminococcus sp. TaxID=41978 RepID=UPI0025D8BDF7|nr:hypothetical protein [Ruminococcus sp.]MBR0530059.1 hypothetical protein [Ruminococcus sp.]
MANGFVNSTDNFQEEEEVSTYKENTNDLVFTKKQGAAQKVEEKFQKKIFDLLGFIDED